MNLSRKGKVSTNVVDLSVGPPAGWTTKTHKRHISKDQALLKKLEDAFQGDQHASSCKNLHILSIVALIFEYRTNGFRSTT
jgi:hypothetical protein